MARSTYHDQFAKLIDRGYLVPNSGNGFDFYEVPQLRPVNIQNSVSSGGLNFDALYYAHSLTYPAITEEIGNQEAKFIRQYNPVLNTQIPKEEDWHKFDVREVDARKFLKHL